MLIVIGIIGVLFSIGFPALMRARAAAGETASLSNARTAVDAIHRHAFGDDGRYPMVQPRTSYAMGVDPWETPAAGQFGMSIAVDPPARWETATWWPQVIRDAAPLREFAEVWLSPGADVDTRISGRFTTSYSFSNSFVAGPRLWSEAFDGDRSALRPVRMREVVHPTRKAMVWDQERAYLHRSVRASENPANARIPVGFPDGHAAVHRVADAQTPIPNQLSARSWRDAPLHNTPDGVRGVDFN